MNGGLLRHRICLQSPAIQQNSDGENVQTFSTYATIWANVVGLNGRQLAMTQANTITSTATHSVTIRWRKDIAVTHQIAVVSTFDQVGFDNLTIAELGSMSVSEFCNLDSSSTATITKTFRINSIVDPDGRRRQLNITATEVAA